MLSANLNVPPEPLNVIVPICFPALVMVFVPDVATKVNPIFVAVTVIVELNVKLPYMLNVELLLANVPV